jgi:ferric iron reductase protein FhuF
MAEINKTDLEKLEGLLQDNLKSSAEVLAAVKSIKKYIRWQQVWSTFRFFLIAVPLVLGFIYLPPIIKDALQTYKSLLLN